jgi:lipopolysaccharide biosynthesis glycosyltransferase
LRSRAVVYVADRGFLIPTLVSAEQMHRQVSDIADVVVAVLGLPADEYRVASEIMTDLKLQPIRMESVDLPAGTRWSDGHVPASSLGRLLLPRYLPRDYRHIIYIDGDTQIVGDVRPLIKLTVPEDYVAAAPDCGWMKRFAGRFPEGYLPGLGIDDPADYFNAGVLAFGRETFDTAMEEALGYFLAHSERCRYHDQSALNAVMRHRRLALSPRYNFLSDYRDTGLEMVFDPVIRHFAGVLKPWRVTGSPIGDAFLGTYVDMVRRFPVLATYAAPVERFAAPDERRRGPVRMLLRAARRRLVLWSDLRSLGNEFVLR